MNSYDTNHLQSDLVTSLDIADAAIALHGCDLGPEDCIECDRLWEARADAHEEPLDDMECLDCGAQDGDECFMDCKA